MYRRRIANSSQSIPLMDSMVWGMMPSSVYGQRISTPFLLGMHDSPWIGDFLLIVLAALFRLIEAMVVVKIFSK